MEPRAETLCEKAVSIGRLTETECLELLGYDECSSESELVIGTADGAVRERRGNTCSIGVQIGVITGPCIADCGFCGFAIGTTKADD